jgi:hypothetical protein
VRNLVEFFVLVKIETEGPVKGMATQVWPQLFASQEEAIAKLETMPDTYKWGVASTLRVLIDE